MGREARDGANAGRDALFVHQENAEAARAPLGGRPREDRDKGAPRGVVDAPLLALETIRRAHERSDDLVRREVAPMCLFGQGEPARVPLAQQRRDPRALCLIARDPDWQGGEEALSRRDSEREVAARDHPPQLEQPIEAPKRTTRSERDELGKIVDVDEGTPRRVGKGFGFVGPKRRLVTGRRGRVARIPELTLERLRERPEVHLGGVVRRGLGVRGHGKNSGSSVRVRATSPGQRSARRPPRCGVKST